MADAPKEVSKTDNKAQANTAAVEEPKAPAAPSKIKLFLAGIKPKLSALVPDVKGGLATAKGAVALFFKNAVNLPMLLVRGDFSSRMILIGFVVSFVVILVTGGELLKRFTPKTKLLLPKSLLTHEGSEMSEFFKNQKELSMASDSMVFLERFSASLNSNAPRVTSFEVEVWMECDKPDTARALKSRMSQVREVVANVMQEQSYEHLLTNKGKEDLQMKIGASVNKILKKLGLDGAVKRVFFSQFVMG